MKANFRSNGGFSLVEVALALGIAAFSLVTLMALIPVGLHNYQQADNQTVMVNLATMVVQDLNTSTGTTTSRFQFPIPTTYAATPPLQTVYVDSSGYAPAGSLNQPPTASSVYRITVSFIYPDTPPNTSPVATVARILITSPALADPAPASPPAHFSTMFETNVALNRN
jgi:uncharacterized protein (TIGR02598 family)